MIYLDHAAATPVSDKVLKAMEPYFTREFFNPSAAYLPAKRVASEYETAKATIAHAIGAKANDLVITAGATEANNLAFTAIAPTIGLREHPSFSERSLAPVVTGLGRSVNDPSSFMLLERGYSSQTNSNSIRVENSNRDFTTPRKTGSAARVLYLETEHDSVRAVAESYGGTPVRVLSNGVIDLTDLKAKITDETELISIALVNNELGTVQPLAEVAEIIRGVKLDRMKRGIRRQLLLHSDASQALSLLNVNVARLGVDLLTLNAAKIYGPKGVGALYVSHDVKLSPLTRGGGQEKGLRSGTENVPGVIGFAKAAELAREHLNGNRKKYSAWRKILLDGLEDYELVNKKHTLDNFVVICYDGLDAERLIFLLEEQEVYVATGAACAASKGVRSHVLKAIGLTESQIAGSLRLTFGECNSEEQVAQAAKIINATVAAERERIGGAI